MIFVKLWRRGDKSVLKGSSQPKQTGSQLKQFTAQPETQLAAEHVSSRVKRLSSLFEFTLKHLNVIFGFLSGLTLATLVHYLWGISADLAPESLNAAIYNQNGRMIYWLIVFAGILYGAVRHYRSEMHGILRRRQLRQIEKEYRKEIAVWEAKVDALQLKHKELDEELTAKVLELGELNEPDIAEEPKPRLLTRLNPFAPSPGKDDSGSS